MLTGIDRRAVLGLFGGGIAVSIASCRPEPASATAMSHLIFENATIVPMTGQGLLTGHAVEVRNGMIAAVAPQSKARADRGVGRIDCAGGYLMPGLADFHVHVEGDPRRDFPLYLANGVTTVRNMSDRQFDHLRIRREVREGLLDGPNYLVSGPSLTSRNLPTVKHVAPMLDRHVALGHDLVKIHGTLAPEVFDELISGAQSRGLKVSGHVQQGAPLSRSLQMDSIEHAEEFLSVPGRKVLEDEAQATRAAHEIAASGIFVVPTLVVFDAISLYLDATRLAALAHRPELKYLPEATRLRWLDERQNPYLARINKPEVKRSLASAVPLLKNFVGKLHKAGVPLLLGTDAAGALVPGFSIHDELRLLVESGLSSIEALRTGTTNVARFLGDPDMGTIEPGKRAELVLLAGNPLAEIANASRVFGVFSRGRWRSKSELDAMLADVADRPTAAGSEYELSAEAGSN